MDSLFSSFYVLDAVAFEATFILLLLLLIQGNPKSWVYFGIASLSLLIIESAFYLDYLDPSMTNPFFMQRFLNLGLAWYGARYGKQVLHTESGYWNNSPLDAGDILHTPHSQANTSAVVYPLLRKSIAKQEILLPIAGGIFAMLLVMGVSNFVAIEYLPFTAGNTLEVLLLSTSLVLLANRIAQGCTTLIISWGLSLFLFAYSAIQWGYDFSPQSILAIIPNIILFFQALYLQKQWAKLPLAK